MKKSTSSIDMEIGSRVRMRRISIGMSQEKLGDMLGLTFQQVQKYEKGTNRISVSRLVDIAKILGVDIHFFFDGIEGGKLDAGFAEEGVTPLHRPSDVDPRRPSADQDLYRRIKNPKVRKSIVQLVAALASQRGIERST